MADLTKPCHISACDMHVDGRCITKHPNIWKWCVDRLETIDADVNYPHEEEALQAQAEEAVGLAQDAEADHDS